MEQIKKRSVVSLGMFDLFKGIMLLTFIWGHTYSLFQFNQTNQSDLSYSFLAAFFNLILAASMVCGRPIFFIVSGYGFRKSSNLKCIANQSKYMLKPYLYTMAGTIGLHFITRYIMIKSIKMAIKVTLPLMAGFILALPETQEIAGTVVYSCGPIYYIVSLYIAWIIYNYIRNLFAEKYLLPASFFCLCIGCLLQNYSLSYFCIPQALCAVLYFHIGYQLKKNKILHKDVRFKTVLGFFGLLMFISLYGIFTNQIVSFQDMLGSLDPVLTALGGAGGCCLLVFILQLNRLPLKSNDFLRKIGNYSIFVFCAHTVELHGIPWYRIPEIMGSDSVFALILVFSLRCLFVAAVSLICINRNKIKKYFMKGVSHAFNSL